MRKTGGIFMSIIIELVTMKLEVNANKEEFVSIVDDLEKKLSF